MLESGKNQKGLIIYQPFFMGITLFSAASVMASVVGLLTTNHRQLLRSPVRASRAHS